MSFFLPLFLSSAGACTNLLQEENDIGKPFERSFLSVNPNREKSLRPRRWGAIVIADDIFWRLREAPHDTWLESRVGGCLLLVRRSDENKWYWSVTRLSENGDMIGQDIAIHSPGTYEHVEIAMRCCQQAFLANFAGHRVLS